MLKEEYNDIMNNLQKVFFFSKNGKYIARASLPKSAHISDISSWEWHPLQLDVGTARGPSHHSTQFGYFQTASAMSWNLLPVPEWKF